MINSTKISSASTAHTRYPGDACADVPLWPDPASGDAQTISTRSRRWAVAPVVGFWLNFRDW